MNISIDFKHGHDYSEYKAMRWRFWAWLRQVKYEYDSQNVATTASLIEFIEHKYGIRPLMGGADSGFGGFTGEYIIVNEELYFLERIKGLKI